MFKNKYLISSLIFTLLSLSIFAQNDNKNVLIENQNVIANTIHKDFGTIYEGDKAEFKFKLKNNNDKPLVIWHVTSSCGCTSPYWTDKPVKKNKTATVKVIYNTLNIGYFNKNLFVYTRFADKPIKLTISGTVLKRKNETTLTKKKTNFNSNIPLNK
jgi:hypothetical protein